MEADDMGAATERGKSTGRGQRDEKLKKGKK